MNHLEHEQSAYLRSAAEQPVHWYPWGEEAFAEAQNKDKPILLDIGAVWCHWCHVMDLESYGNPRVAAIINDNYVAIKVDRDERPDVDSRYQAAVNSIAGQGGWPLTGFLMPDGRLFYGGTYFPPEERQGRPGFPEVLLTLAQAYRNDREKALRNAEEVERVLNLNLSRKGEQIALSEDLLDIALNTIAHEFDIRHGGFGTSPKFPHPATIELLLACHARTGEEWMLTAVTKTLHAMAAGGVYDQLGGGFHRYSTDERWRVPHFEKMLYDNGPLLLNYVHAWRATQDPAFRTTALDILRFVNSTLADREHGGFYASQDADVEFGDDGSYFTWSAADAERVLTADEFRVARTLFHLADPGEMKHDPSQHVLYLHRSIEETAWELNLDGAAVHTLAGSARQKLFDARTKRRTPYIDTTLFANWNGLMIRAQLEAATTFALEEEQAFALRSLDRILREHRSPSGLITHRTAGFSMDAFLDDQMEIVRALLTAYEITGDLAHLKTAESLLKAAIEHFWDPVGEAFNDIPSSHRKLGSVTVQNKPVQDSPTNGGNGTALHVFQQFYTLTGAVEYQEYSEKILNHFAEILRPQGLFASTFFHGLQLFLNPPPHCVIVAAAGNEMGTAFYREAVSHYFPDMLITRVDPGSYHQLPANLKSMAEVSPKPTAYVCTNFVCSAPATDVETLRSVLKPITIRNQ